MDQTIALLTIIISTILDYLHIHSLRLFIYLIVATHMFSTTTAVATTSSINNCKRIAICGCGITGSIISNLLLKQDPDRYSVHVFEAGRGPGGRSSTRHVDGYNFDHG